MGRSASVGIGVKIRVFILFILGMAFTIPGVLLLIAGFMEPDITADDTLAMFFMGALVLFCGLTILWMMRSMYRRAKYRIVSNEDRIDPMAVGLAQGHYMASMQEPDDIGDVEVDSGDSTDFDIGGD